MLSTLLNTLHAKGHLQVSPDELPPIPQADATLSLWIVALQIIGAWLAALFLLGFVGSAFALIARAASSWMILGVLLSASAGLALQKSILQKSIEQDGSLVTRQFILALSLAGHGALIVAISTSRLGLLAWASNLSLEHVLLIIYELILFCWVAWLPHRLIAAAIALYFLPNLLALILPSAWISLPALYWLAACALWLFEPRWRAKPYAGIAYALAITLTLLHIFGEARLWLFNTSYFSAMYRELAATKHITFCAISCVSLLYLARKQLNNARHIGAAFILLLGLIATWQAPNLGFGVLIMLFGYARQRAWMSWLGGAVALFALSWLYYSLQISLLDKAGLMVLSGVLLLLARLLLKPSLAAPLSTKPLTPPSPQKS